MSAVAFLEQHHELSLTMLELVVVRISVLKEQRRQADAIVFFWKNRKKTGNRVALQPIAAYIDSVETD